MMPISQCHATVLDQVAEWHHQQQADAVSDLSHGHDEPGRFWRQPDGGAYRACNGLPVVEIAGHQSAGDGQQRYEPGRDGVFDRGTQIVLLH